MPHLALCGAEPLRTAPFAPWPVFDAADEIALLEVLRSGHWFLAGKVAAFEARFAAFQQARFGLALSSGTTALQVALEALGVGPGDEVILPSYTFIATASAVVLVGGIPIFVDVEPHHYTIDPAAAAAAITPRTRALIAVHLAGHPADMDALGALAQEHSIPLLEDAAQAHAAAWKGRRVGALGEMGTFSFQASKNLNAGEGGFITTGDPRLAARAWSLHNCGRTPEGAWYEHALVGGNYRMTEFQAALLLSQFERLEKQVDRRTRNAEALDALLEPIEGVAPLKSDPRVTTHAHHLYIFRYQAQAFGGLPRERFLAALQAEGIPCSAGYRPLYREPAFAARFSSGPFESAYFGGRPDYSRVHCPVTERICAEEAVWLTQNLLLGSSSDLRDIAAAIDKIRANVPELEAQ